MAAMIETWAEEVGEQGETGLPDLSVAPEGGREVIVSPDEYLNAIEDSVDIEGLDLDELGRRAEVYGQKVEKAAEKRKEREDPKNPPDLEKPPLARKPPPSSTQKGVEARPTKGAVAKVRGKVGRGAAAASRALRMSTASGTTPPIRPLEDKGEKPGEKKERVKEMKEPTPTIDPPPDLAPETPASPLLGDEDFPDVAIPAPSDEYQALSLISTQHDNAQAELVALTAQLKVLIGNIATLNTHVAVVQKDVQALKQDKSSFMSDVLDRIRAIERQLQPHPSITTPASAVTPPQTAEKTTTEAPETPTQKTMDTAAFLAHMKQHKAMRNMK